MTTGSEPGPEMFVVVTVKVAAVRLQHARMITEHNRGEYVVFIISWLLSATRTTGQKIGARTQRALHRGTAKRLSEKRAKPRPMGRARWFSEGLENSRFSMQPVAEATLNCR